MTEEYLVDAKARYDADGFLKVEGLLSADDLALVDEELARYEREVTPTLPPTDVVWEKELLPDGTRRVRNLWRMQDYSEFFARLGERPEWMALASRLVNGEALITGVELFAKPAQVGSVVPHHQDNAYFTLAPPDCFTLWIALDASTEENGCVYYSRGSHRTLRIPHRASGVLGNSMMAGEVPSELDEVPGLLVPGDAMLHHCMTLHRSEPNRSDKPRRGLLIVYRGAHCRVDPEAAREYAAIRDALQSGVA